MSFDDNEVRNWTEQEVCNWLKYTNKGHFEEYVPLFREHEISGDTLLSLTNEVLRDEMGIKNVGKRHKLLKAITKLKQKSNINRTFSAAAIYDKSHTKDISKQSLLPCTFLPFPII